MDCNTDNKTSQIFHVLLHFLAKISDKSFLFFSNVHSLFLYERIRHSCLLPWGLQYFFSRKFCISVYAFSFKQWNISRNDSINLSRSLRSHLIFLLIDLNPWRGLGWRKDITVWWTTWAGLAYSTQHTLQVWKGKVKVAQSCLTIWDLMDCSPLGSSVHGILQARILEWVAIPFSGDLPNPGIEPRPLSLQADSLPSEQPGKPAFRYVDQNWLAAAAKLLQSCPTLCDPIDGSPPGSPVPGILQARTLEWVAISFSNAWKWKVKVKLLSRVRLLATPWTAAQQAPPSMGFSRQEYWSGVPLPSPNWLAVQSNYVRLV